MRDYGRVYSSFWQSPEVRAMSEDGRTLALYLLTSPHANLIGCFRLPDAYAAEDLQWTAERVSEGFQELSSKGFVSRDEGTKWVVIHKYVKWNSFENANVAKAARKAFDQVPDVALKSLLAKALLEFGAFMEEGFRKACETLCEPFANPEPEPEPIQNQSLTQNRTRSRKVASADAPPPKTSAVWDAYSKAYELRYQAAPVRNAKVNAQLGQFVDRLGAEEAPEVAAFYLRHQARYYVQQMHSIGPLVADCEKLRTEWATGRQTTATQALQADKTQTNFNAFAPLLAQAEAANGQH